MQFKNTTVELTSLKYIFLFFLWNRLKKLHQVFIALTNFYDLNICCWQVSSMFEMHAIIKIPWPSPNTCVQHLPQILVRSLLVYWRCSKLETTQVLLYFEEQNFAQKHKLHLPQDCYWGKGLFTNRRIFFLLKFYSLRGWKLVWFWD